ncbi:MAG TPA: single-stranded DNA-binding protein [Clostridia bacterium]|nr:single-stranded DNA-binding protein [Clostridia bacterium]
MNRVFLIGRLTRDPELRSTASGVSVCTFTLAVNRRFANTDGKREADFIPIVTWRGLADNCAKYLRKGSQAAICGVLQTRSYDKDGQKRYVTEVVADDVEFLARSDSTDRSPGYEDAENPYSDISPVDDEVPF